MDITGYLYHKLDNKLSYRKEGIHDTSLGVTLLYCYVIEQASAQQYYGAVKLQSDLNTRNRNFKTLILGEMPR